MVRGISSNESIKLRENKEVKTIPKESVVHIDGFNIIITLEVALSESLLLKSMDGTIRDLAGLRGTYRLIDKTDKAITLIGKFLDKNKIDKAIFYLDAPVSNSGKLKQRIIELFEQFECKVEVEVVNNVDSVLEKLDNIITSDAIILDKCVSWINMNKSIIQEFDKDYPYIDFSKI